MCNEKLLVTLIKFITTVNLCRKESICFIGVEEGGDETGWPRYRREQV